MFFRYNLFPIAWTLLIIFLTLFPGQEMPDISIWDMFSFDKFAHIFVFAVLVLLMIVGFSKQYDFTFLKKNPVRYSLLYAFLLAFFIELAQKTIIAGRGFEFMDLLADSIGILLGWLAFFIIYKLELRVK